MSKTSQNPLVINDSTVSIHQGFPNPATDQLSSISHLSLDINQLLIKNPSSSYIFRIKGNFWEKEGIFNNDLALINRAILPSKNQFIVLWEEDNFVICKASCTPITHIWGTVTAIIHQY